MEAVLKDLLRQFHLGHAELLAMERLVLLAHCPRGIGQALRGTVIISQPSLGNFQSREHHLCFLYNL